MFNGTSLASNDYMASAAKMDQVEDSRTFQTLSKDQSSVKLATTLKDEVMTDSLNSDIMNADLSQDALSIGKKMQGYVMPMNERTETAKEFTSVFSNPSPVREVPGQSALS